MAPGEYSPGIYFKCLNCSWTTLGIADQSFDAIENLVDDHGKQFDGHCVVPFTHTNTMPRRYRHTT